MLNSTKYPYKLTFIKCSYEHPITVRQIISIVTITVTTQNNLFLMIAMPVSDDNINPNRSSFILHYAQNDVLLQTIWNYGR